MLFLWAYIFPWDCVYFFLIRNNFWMPCGNCANVSLNTSGQHAGWVTDREGKSQAMEKGGVSEREREKKRDAGAKTQSNGTWVKNPVSVNWHPLRQSRNAGTVTLLRPGITSASRRFDWTGNKFQTCARQMMTNAACAEPVLQTIQQSGGQSRAEERQRRAFASEFICFTCNPILSNSKKKARNDWLWAHHRALEQKHISAVLAGTESQWFGCCIHKVGTEGWINEDKEGGASSHYNVRYLWCDSKTTWRGCCSFFPPSLPSPRPPRNNEEK